MLCFVQGLSERKNSYSKSREPNCDLTDAKLKLSKKDRKKATHIDTPDVIVSSDFELRKFGNFIKGKSLRLQRDTAIKDSSEIKRSFSDRFTVISDSSGKKTSKSFLAIRKNWSTGNFASSAAGGGVAGAARSAPATPLQLEPHARSKHDKHAVKPLSGSAPSVRTAAEEEPAPDIKLPSKSRQKKFQRHFPQVGPEERVVNYYSCALVGDLLLQGHLYITKNYFAFYSNVFGYVTKLLIPTTSVIRITKEKVARIIPNAVGVCTRDERHVFGSLLSRDSTYKLMMQVWKATMVPEVVVPPEETRTSEVELEASEYSPEDDSSSGGAEPAAPPAAPAMPEPEAIIAAAASAAVIQPALLTGGPPPPVRQSPHYWHAGLLLLAFLLSCSALFFTYSLVFSPEPQEEVSGEELYAELARWRERLHGRAAHELQAFLTTNLLLLTKVRQSLEALSGVILADIAMGNREVPKETVAS